MTPIPVVPVIENLDRINEPPPEWPLASRLPDEWTPEADLIPRVQQLARIPAYDLGAGKSMLRHLARLGLLESRPAETPPARVEYRRSPSPPEPPIGRAARDVGPGSPAFNDYLARAGEAERREHEQVAATSGVYENPQYRRLEEAVRKIVAEQLRERVPAIVAEALRQANAHPATGPVEVRGDNATEAVQAEGGTDFRPVASLPTRTHTTDMQGREVN